MWAADLQPRDLSWSKVDAINHSIPAARYRHTATAISKTRMLVFGGLHGSGNQRLNDSWIFDSSTRSWSQVFVPGLSASQGLQGRQGQGAPRGLGKHGLASKAGGLTALSRAPSVAVGGRSMSTAVGGGGGGLRPSFAGLHEGGGSGGFISSFVANALASGPSVGGVDAGLTSFGTSFTGSSDDVLADVGQMVEETGGSAAGGPNMAVMGEDVPAPRAGHTAVCIGEHVWLFGGYGGNGYSRRDFGDVHRFHIPSQTWSAVKASGAPLSESASSDPQSPAVGQASTPLARSGHSAVAVGDLMIIHGGWSVSGAFQDTWALDTTTLIWRRITTSLDAAGAGPATRWGHAMVAVPAVPNWQVFAFGGNTNSTPAGVSGLPAGKENAPSASSSALSTLGATGEPSKPGGAGAVGGAGTRFLGDTLVLDTGSFAWTELAGKPSVNAPHNAAAAAPTTTTATTKAMPGVGKPAPSAPGSASSSGVSRPAPRADCSVVYDPFNKRVILFGGWAHRWMNDAWALPVGGLVGPPYAVLGLEPAHGPITGAQPLVVRGKGFEPGVSASVRFALGKRSVEAVGTCRSDSEIELQTPAFEPTGPGALDVRVSLKGQPWSITSRPYGVFHVTSAATSHAFGPGLLNGCHAGGGGKAVFLVLARDTAGVPRTAGGDEFTVAVTQLEDGAVDSASTRGNPVPATVTDEGNGRYAVAYAPPAPGAYLVSVQFAGTFGGQAGHIRGSPFRISARDPKATAAEGEGVGAAPAAPTGGSGPAKDANSFSGPLVWEAVKSLLDVTTSTAKATLEGISKDITAEAAAPSAASAGVPALDLVLSVKSHLTDVVAREGEMRLSLDSAQGIIDALRREGVRSEREISALEAKLGKAAAMWDAAARQAPTARAALVPFVKHWSQQTRKDVEAFEAATASFVAETEKAAYWSFGAGFDAASSALVAHGERFASFMRRVDRMAHVTTTLDLPHALSEVHKSVKAVADDTADMQRLWGVAQDAVSYFASARECLWTAFVPDELEEGTKALQKRLKAPCTKRVRGSDAYKGADKAIKDFVCTLPLMGALRHKSMRPRHWGALLEKVAHGAAPFSSPERDPTLRLGALLDLRLHEHANDVEETCDQAVKEAKMEETLAKLSAAWGGVEWHGEPVKEGSEVMLVRVGEDDWEMCEADQLTIQGMMTSRYLAHFETQVTAWQRDLASVSEVATQLSEIQRKWAYLAALFIASEEVRKELPEDAARFEGIDVQVTAILKAAWATKKVKDACNVPGLLPQLEGLQSGLDACEKALSDFISRKQSQFPRFYFVSRADLLDILSNGSSPRRIVHHVPKVLLATDSLALQDGLEPGSRPVATSWTACVGVETVRFSPPVPLEGKVEVYMQTVLDAQRDALRRALDTSIRRRATQERVDWIMDKLPDGSGASDPAQITLLVSGTDYVRAVDEAFDALGTNPGAMQACLDRAVADLNDLIRLTQSNLSRADRSRVMCLITLDAHGRDIIQKLIAEGVKEKNAFQWQSQLKQRYMGNGRACLEIADARFDYQFEYLGNGPRLVVTPLTDRIYVTATQALNLKLGCAPAGPAGTGKTETTKDLSSAMAIPCYVVNCAPEMDYRSLAGIFKGLAASGSWGCFDEFNRLVPEVLSVCATQFGAVLDSIRAQRSEVVIEGDTVRCIPTAGAFITMNPGYLGRSELPEGLKSLFRPITVMIPDLVLICENMLMAEGFVEAKVLASKFYSLYSLCKELLSKQAHYDWGLRAIKSVLVVAGSFKRAEPHLPEDVLLMRALRDFNTPKLPTVDEGPFFGLLGDLFPGVAPPRKQDPTLEEAVVAACAKRGLDPDEQFRLKVVQLEELLAIRHCVFVIGPPGSGKSTCWQTLVGARAEMRRKTKVVDLDPKVQSPEELYGYVHPATREWKDGLLSRIMRDLASEPGDDAKWILLDGDLDANWIESMNSVMDDNKLLTLASNERIPLKPHMRMVFEIRDLRFASPATVSRAGIIYISTQTGSQWRSLIATWLKRLGRESEDGGPDAAPVSTPDTVVHTTLRGLFDRYCAPTLLFLRKECKPIVPTEDVTLITNLLRLLDATLPPALLKKLSDPAATPPEEAARVLETHFVFAAVWAFGAALTVVDSEDYRASFSNWWRSEFKAVKMPSRDTVFDYWLNPASVQFDSWKASPFFAEVAFDSRKMAMGAVTVPTPETCAISFWSDMLLRARKPVMLAGYAGCGKTQLISGLLASQPSEERLSATVNFNFFTGSRELQATLEAPLEKKTGANFGPKGKAQLVFFLDDVNLPEVDRYDTQSAIALVRQHLDYGHWYDRGKLTAKNIQSCQYVAAMNPSAGSFQVNPRLQRHFFTLAVGFPGPTSLHTIFSTFLDGHLRSQGFIEEVQGCAANLLSAALTLHASVASTFRKSATCFHYEFTVRQLASIFSGLLQSTPGEFKEPGKLAALWLHESERVYGDRLVSVDDVAKYRGLAAGIAKKKFPAANLGAFFAAERPDPLLFSHFSPESAASGVRVYDRVLTTEKMRTVVEDSLKEYNETYAAMNLVLFDDALNHVARIARVLMQPQGHALLVGVGGSGKQSLARLAASMCGYRVMTITIQAGYGLNEFMADVQAMYKVAGLKDEGIVFLFTDSQITNERFLVVLNDVLASGNVPGLFPPEEEDTVVAAMAPKVKAATGVSNPSREACWAHFIATVKRNLHVVLCFSPVGDDFRSRAKRFPALSNATTIDWFHAWPREALHSVAVQFMRGVDLAPMGLANPDAVKEGITKFMPFAFDTVNRAAQRFGASDRRHVYTTPKSFLECLKLYAALLRRKHDDNETARNRLATGLAKLRETATAVAKIEEELKVSLVAAEEKRGVAEGIAAEVSANKTVVEGETAKANVLAEECSGIAARANAIREDAERDLAAAIPAVQKAMEALNTLDKKDLAESKTMAKTPPGVDDVFAAVMVLLAGVRKEVKAEKSGKVKDRSWDAAKKALLGDIKAFMEQLMAFKDAIDSDEVPEVNFKEIRPYLDLEHFTPEVIRTKNSAAAGLCSWVINIVSYYDIVVQVEPKKARLREANAELEGANAKLSIVQGQVAKLQEQLDELNVKLTAAEGEKAAAIADVDHGRGKLELATRLTAALADENVRWAQNIDEMEASKDRVVGDTLLAAAFISYIGPFTKRYRDELVHKAWVPFLETAAGGQRIPMSPTPNPLGVLTDEATIAGWNSEGLPDDTVSVENGAICVQTDRWPLLIDPQLQGISWLREREKANGLVVLRLDQKDMLRRLEMAIERGTPVIIENIPERIDAVLQPVIARSLVRRGNRKYLKLGDREVEYHPSFRLYLHTKLSNPHYAPEVQAETALVNFTVTEAGLEEQLLALTVGRERPDLSAEKTALIRQSNAFKVQIKALEDGILAKLASAQGDITEDRELIESLENTKRIALDIAKKSIVVAKTTAEINTTSEKYRSVAHRSALLFFLMQDLGRIHTYYSFSLAAFITVFNRAIDSVSGANDPSRTPEQHLEDAAAAGGEKEEETAEGEGEAAASSDGAPVEAAAAADADGAADGAGAQPTASFDTSALPAAATSPAAAASTPSPKRVKPSAPIRALTDSELVARCVVLRDATTSVTYRFINRGLFEKDRLTVAAHLCLKLLMDAGEVSDALARALVVGPTLLGEAGPVPASLADWLPESVWLRVRSLESIRPTFEHLGEDMSAASTAWKAWFDCEKPEGTPPPGEYAALGGAGASLYALLLLRTLRPDRVTAGLRTFIASKLGELYVQGEPFSMPFTFAESSPSVPIFFVLFPGVDPTVWVEELGRTRGITQDNGRLVNISMGQGQEARAMGCLKDLAARGGWVLLQNVHLMSSWLPALERQLELLADGAHPDFRCFISAEPPPLASMANMPESLLQGAIKVANEAPADLQSNLARSWATFSEEKIATCKRPAMYKACLFALCFYHAIVLGRRRFGTQGWSRKYSFNTGDLTVCANVLCEYINANPDAVPWQDLRYIFGEIMYGGHITDAWDRRTNNTYLSELLRPEVCAARSKQLAPGFCVPDTTALDFAGVAQYIATKLPRESPGMFGLHTNAEIGYLTATGDELLKTILSMSPLLAAAPAAPAAGGGGASKEAAPTPSGGPGSGVRPVLEGLLERLPSEFVMIELELQAAPLLKGPTAPFVLVCLQECESMNGLLQEVRRSLVELRKGLDGALNMSEPMEDLLSCLLINQVPGRNPLHKCSWERLAWPSRRGLQSWFADMLRRVEQLARWSESFTTPVSVWLPGLFNPLAYITAVVQRTSRASGQPLDKMTVNVHVTSMTRPEQASAYPASGMFVHGLFMEGAGWPAVTSGGAGDADVTAAPAVQMVNGTPTCGNVTDAKLKQLLQPMPVLYLEAVPVQPTWLPSSVGYLRQDPSVYECPVYSTTMRGPTYVCLATLRSKEHVNRWTLAGAALVMQEDD